MKKKIILSTKRAHFQFFYSLRLFPKGLPSPWKGILQEFVKAWDLYVRQHPVFGKNPNAQYFVDIECVGEKKIQKINAEFRGKNKPTDVLSFAYQEDFIPSLDLRIKQEIYLGEMFLCWAIAKKQSKEFKISLEEEILHLLVHGLVHLYGYDHEVSPAEEKKMQEQESQFLEFIKRVRKSRK